MLKLLNTTLRRLCSRFRRRRSRPKVVVIINNNKKKNKFGKTHHNTLNDSASAVVHPNAPFDAPTIRIATFNAALFSMAPATSTATLPSPNSHSISNLPSKSRNQHPPPKSILKHSHPLSLPLHHNSNKPQKLSKSVSINLPDNEISLLRHRQASFTEYEIQDPSSSSKWENSNSNSSSSSSRCVADVLRELDADILALQDVKAEEENDMKPLSDLANALGLNYYVFADSWAPQYGNAVLSKWPINRSNVHKIFEHHDFRNVLKVTIDVPQVGEVNVQCTHLDHLDENWRMKQINSIIQSTNNEPHILLGALNSLDPTDYSHERWIDIVKYYEEIGKPTPKAEVMKLLKSMQYTDAKDFAGECESVVMIAKGQSVQGTCKYGTRVDYILASPNAGYEFVKGSYSVFSSKGTSDHHIVKVDLVKAKQNNKTNTIAAQVTETQPKHNKVINISASSPLHSIWKLHT